jgi:hypothetical protein
MILILLCLLAVAYVLTPFLGWTDWDFSYRILPIFIFIAFLWMGFHSRWLRQLANHAWLILLPREQSRSDRVRQLLAFFHHTYRAVVWEPSRLLLRGVRLVVGILAPLRLHLVVLAVVWYAANTGQFSSLYAVVRGDRWWIATFALYITILGSAFRLLAFTRKVNAWSLATVVILSTSYWASLPGCYGSAIVTVRPRRGLVRSNGGTA